jgi:hypothetical protein
MGDRTLKPMSQRKRIRATASSALPDPSMHSSSKRGFSFSGRAPYLAVFMEYPNVKNAHIVPGTYLDGFIGFSLSLDTCASVKR